MTPLSPASRADLLADAVQKQWNRKKEAADPLPRKEAAFVQLLQDLQRARDRLQQEDDYLQYNVPKAPWPSLANLRAMPEPRAPEAMSGKIGEAYKLDDTTNQDLGALPDVRREEPRVAQWAPVTDVQPMQYVPDDDDNSAFDAISRASIFEHLSANCRTKGAGRAAENAGWLARAAAAKLLQMRHVATVAAMQDSLPPRGRKEVHTAEGGGPVTNEIVFLTRPAHACDNKPPMFPCDAGLAVFSYDAGVHPERRAAMKALQGLPPGNVKTVDAGAVSNGQRAAADRGAATGTLQAMGTGLYLGPVAPGRPENLPELERRDLAGPSAASPYPDDAAALARGVREVAPRRLCGVRCAGAHAPREGAARRDARARRGARRRRGRPRRCRRAGAEAAADGLGRRVARGGARQRPPLRLRGSWEAPSASPSPRWLRSTTRSWRRRAARCAASARTAERAAMQHMQLVRDVMEQVLVEQPHARHQPGGVWRRHWEPEGGQRLAAQGGARAQRLKEAGSSSTASLATPWRSRSLDPGTGEMTLKDLLERLRDAGLAMQRARSPTPSGDGVCPGRRPSS